MGASTPPMAAMMGRAAWRMFVSSPTVISYLISNPTSRKNTAIKISLMMWAKDISPIKPPTPTTTWVCQNSSKGSKAGEFAMMSATIAAASMMAAALVDEFVNWITLSQRR